MSILSKSRALQILLIMVLRKKRGFCLRMGVKLGNTMEKRILHEETSSIIKAWEDFFFFVACALRLLLQPIFSPCSRTRYLACQLSVHFSFPEKLARRKLN